MFSVDNIRDDYQVPVTKQVVKSGDNRGASSVANSIINALEYTREAACYLVLSPAITGKKGVQIKYSIRNVSFQKGSLSGNGL